ncbi:ferredoxin [Streptomyces sparsogenes DSM 40356]|uniref:Ferredoxin n=1 Tax=Streptomyces sparsogenes DSM 40356 TaxID=1331668 RepID=A0A1R1SBG5_9ACTN|nr:ferredoxin [Streptomyces sparsogenes DSM 40356]
MTIDESKCIDRCTRCVDMCPPDSLAIDDSSGKAYMHVDECWYCGPCAARCPTGAVGPGHARRGGAGQRERGGTRTCERRQDGLRGARVSMSLPTSGLPVSFTGRRSGIRPGLGVLREAQDLVGQLGRGHVGQGDLAEDLPDVGAYGDPQRQQRLRGTTVGELGWAHSPHRDQGAVRDADDVGDGDRLRRAGEPVAALAAPLADHKTAPAQVAEDALQEFVRDALRRCDRLGLERGLAP